MRTKTLILAVIGLTFISQSLFAQKPNRSDRKEKIQAMKVAYITKKLDLTTEEAEKFWPVYNAYEKKREDNHKRLRDNHKKMEVIDELTDAEVTEMVDLGLDVMEKGYLIHKEALKKYKSILPIKKVAKLHKAEKDFKKDLLRTLKNKKGKGGGHPIGPPPHGGPH